MWQKTSLKNKIKKDYSVVSFNHALTWSFLMYSITIALIINENIANIFPDRMLIIAKINPILAITMTNILAPLFLAINDAAIDA